jgi:hypothetical protein
MTKHLANDQEIEFKEIKFSVFQEIHNFDQEIESFFSGDQNYCQFSGD